MRKNNSIVGGAVLKAILKTYFLIFLVSSLRKAYEANFTFTFRVDCDAFSLY